MVTIPRNKFGGFHTVNTSPSGIPIMPTWVRISAFDFPRYGTISLEIIMHYTYHHKMPNRLFTFLAFWMVCSIGQAQQLDLSKFKREHLITNSRIGETGDVSIYLSFPNWFGRRPGYYPIRIRVVPSKGLNFKRDGMLKVNIGASYYGNGKDRQAVVDIPIESGTSEATGEILANVFAENYFSITATLNGRKLYGQQVHVYNMGAANTKNECKNLILISKESSKTDFRRLEALAEMDETGNWYSQEKHLQATFHTAAYCNVANMPPNWLCLSSLEQVTIGFDDLVRLDAKGLDTINNYVLSGGFLTINKVNSGSEVAKYLPIDLSRQSSEKRKNAVLKIEQDLMQSASDELVPSDFDPPSLDPFENTVWDRFVQVTGREELGVYSGINFGVTDVSPDWSNIYDEADWLTSSLLETGRSYLDAQLASPIEFVSHLYDTFSAPSSKTVGGKQEIDETSPPFFVAHGFGRVFLDNSRRDDHYNAYDEKSKSRALIVQNQIVQDLGNRTARMSHGVGDDFWDWLIPSVGRTPVIPFLIFVVLFVGGAAPGLMVWANRHKRRVWLVVLMPLAAVICTIFLFGYGLLKDGLGAVSRTRSLAFVDKNGDGLVWSRQTYFAATVPKQGIIVGGETHFSPMTVNSYSELSSSEQYEVGGMQQYRGLLPPRLQTQFSLTHPIRKLPIVKSGPEQDPILAGPAIVNASNFTWDKAVFVGSNDRYYVASSVGPGQKAECIATTRSDAVLVLQKKYRSQALVPPPDSPSADQTSLGQAFTDIFSFNRSRANTIGQILEEKTWADHLGMASSDQTVLLPGTYVLFVSDAPYLERCLSGVKDQDGLHAIVGRW